jgi:hypothetical protein
MGNDSFHDIYRMLVQELRSTPLCPGCLYYTHDPTLWREHIEMRSRFNTSNDSTTWDIDSAADNSSTSAMPFSQLASINVTLLMQKEDSPRQWPGRQDGPSISLRIINLNIVKHVGLCVRSVTFAAKSVDLASNNRDSKA